MSNVEVIPGERIGAIVLGTSRSELPPGTVFEAEIGGEYSGVHFMLDNDRVTEVWISDLRKLGKPVQYQGALISNDESVESLKRRFGPCRKVPGVIGGARYRCDSGIQLGFDAGETGRFVQIRIRAA